MSEKTVAGIITFNPEINRLKDNLTGIYNQVDKVIIIDNASENINEIEALESTYLNLEIIRNQKNSGIAKALNQIGGFADDNGYVYFLTLDQDSVANIGLVTELKNCFIDESVGMACPYINRYDDYVFRDKTTEVFSCITSGSLVKTDVWKQINGFWEYLFIDEVDHEFCYHMRECGYKIIQSERTSIDHIIGVPTEKVVLGHVFHPTNHSAFRRYYITRNCILMKLLYPDEKHPFCRRYDMLFRIFVSTLVCEEYKIKKIKAMICGAKDAFTWYRHNKKIETRRL